MTNDVGHCPACGSVELTPGYSTGPVPATSSLLMADRTAARAVPKGQVTLARCRSCGFITNTSFDPSLFDYSPDFEDSQACSAVFDQWSRDLARRWVARHRLQGAKVVEVGCGKGDFLVSLVEAGVGRGVGIDPAAQPGRHAGAAADRIEWVNEPYATDHERFPADALVCRHTLEHIPDVEDFVGLMATTHASAPSVTVLVEVPDTLRVIREGAFWDVYHEHCSYFSPASLTGLFVRAGFDVEEAAPAYDDQYLLLTARRAVSDAVPLAPEDGSGVGSEEFAAFTAASERARAGWIERVVDAGASGTVAVWGAGSKAVAFLSALGPAADHVAFAVDINPRKWDHFLPGTGHRVLSPEAAAEHGADLVIAMNPVYLQEIGARLSASGLTPELVALGSEVSPSR